MNAIHCVMNCVKKKMKQYNDLHQYEFYIGNQTYFFSKQLDLELWEGIRGKDDILTDSGKKNPSLKFIDDPSLTNLILAKKHLSSGETKTGGETGGETKTGGRRKKRKLKKKSKRKSRKKRGGKRKTKRGGRRKKTRKKRRKSKKNLNK